MPSITPIMSEILRAAVVDALDLSTTWPTTSPPCTATEAPIAKLVGLAGVIGVLAHGRIAGPIDAAVCSLQGAGLSLCPGAQVVVA